MENVILLMMSTLPPEPKMNVYRWKYSSKTVQEDWYFKGVSQLEPGTKLIFSRLGNSKKKVHRIVILNTEKTATEKVTVSPGLEMTASEFYKQRIIDYLQGTNICGVQDSLPEYPEHKETQDFPAENFIEISLENEDCLLQTIRAVRGQNADEKVHVYLDTQGGNRSSVTTLYALLQLLNRRNTVVKDIYAIKGFRSNQVNEISRVNSEYKNSDLVTAMTLFADFGRSDRLAQFFKNEHDPMTTQIMQAISQASSAIQMCDVEGFSLAARKILLLKEQADHCEDLPTHMRIVLDDIYQEYKPLVDSQFPFIEQIRWCLENGFIQQALTIFEAKIPTELVHSGICSYLRESDYPHLAQSGMDPREYALDLIVEIFDCLHDDRDEYRMKDLNHYFVCTYAKDLRNARNMEGPVPRQLRQDFSGPRLRVDINPSGYAERNILSKYFEICKIRNNTNHAASEGAPNGFYAKVKYMGKWNVPQEPVSAEEVKKQLSNWLNMFGQYCSTRQIPNDIIDLS